MEKYSVTTRALHWLAAVVVFFLFGFGLWMESLDYYHSWYQRAPIIHIGVGLIFVVMLLSRLINRLVLQRRLGVIASLSLFERLASKVVHVALYCLMGFMGVSGYLLAGLEDGLVTFFGLIDLPAGVTSLSDARADQFKELHETVAFGLVFLALGHGAFAVKHHVFNKDATLKRMGL